MDDIDFSQLPPAQQVGRLIRDARNSYGYSQTFLAEVLGVDQATVSKWEHGRLPTTTHLSGLLHHLRKQLDAPTVLRKINQHREREAAEPQAAA